MRSQSMHNVAYRPSDIEPMAEPTVIGRFAPTPSGRMHLGNVFSCLMAWLSARSAGGRIVLRIEDLDPRAQDKAVADRLMADLEWLGLPWDEGPYRQSERTDIYEDAVRRLGELGLTYPCFCTRAELHAATAPHASDGTYLYAGTCRDLTPDQIAEHSCRRAPATRLRVPDKDDPAGTIEFCDLAYGPQKEVLARECGDFLVRRSDGVFAYQLAVVVDDGLMGVNQVVRGRDLLATGLPRAAARPCDADLRPCSLAHRPGRQAPVQARPGPRPWGAAAAGHIQPAHCRRARRGGRNRPEGRRGVPRRASGALLVENNRRPPRGYRD